jgi:hypothetical protein
MKLFMVKVFTQFRRARGENCETFSRVEEILVYASVLGDYARQLMKRKTSRMAHVARFLLLLVHESTTLKMLVSGHASEYLSEI